jgi:hypothetical protein
VPPPEEGPTYTNQLTEGQRPVEVGVKNLTEYAGKIFKIYMNSQMASAKAFTDIPTLLAQGLTMPNDGVSPLAEGKMAFQSMDQRIADFQAFLGEMNSGVLAIANASQVVAYTFDETDSENGATIGDVAFAFADEGTQRPAGFDKRLLLEGGKTMEQQQAELAAEQGSTAGSYQGLYGNLDGARTTYATPYGTGYEWPDGSRLTADYRTETEHYPYGGSATVYITTYTVYDKDDRVIGTRVQRTTTGTGATNESVEITAGEANTRTSTTTFADGHIQTSSTQTRPGVDGEPETTYTTHETDPEDHTGDTRQDGPVEEAQDRYDTRGSQRSQQEYGVGY